MRGERRWWAVGLWGTAGLPIVATFVQALFALTGVPPESVPVVGALTEGLQSMRVFAVAARVFESNPDVVPILFVLVTVAWLAEGGLTFGLRKRQYAYAAAGFVTLFLLLFLLAYMPLFSADIPAAQLVLFVGIALVTAGASWGAVYVYDWDPDLDAETVSLLREAREDARDARQRFVDAVDEQLDDRTRDRLRPAAAEAVGDAEERIDAFRGDCESVLSAADDIENDGSASPRERRQRADDLAAQAAKLEPAARAEAVVDTLRSRLVDALARTYGDLHVVSRYGTEYRVRNLTAYNSVSLDTVGVTAQVGGDAHDLGERLSEAAETEPLPAVAAAVEDAEAHVDELESTIETREAAFAETVAEAHDRVDTAKEEISAVEGSPGDRLRELLVEGRYEADDAPGPAATDVEAAVDEGKAALHDCDFAVAEDHADRAAELAGELIAVAEFFRLVAETVADEGDSVPLPSSVDPPLARAMKLAFERGTGVDYEVVDGRVEFGYPDDRTPDSTPTPAVDADGSGASDATDAADPSEVVDEVLYVLRELESNADGSNATDVVELQTETLPEQCTEAGVLESLAQFGTRQHGVERIDIQPGAPPGYLELHVDDGESPRAVVSRIHERYLERHGT